MPPDHRAEPAKPVDLGALFPAARKLRPIKALDIPFESAGLEGEAMLQGKPRWWRRIFRWGPWQRWRAWAVRHEPLCLIATYTCQGTRDPEAETVATMILNTLELPDIPADPPEIFEQRVMALAQAKFPLLPCERGEDFQLQLGESNINLFNFYRSYVNAPDRFEEIVLPALTTVVQVQEWGVEQTDPPLERVRDRIMPMLYPESVWRENFPNFVGEPWVAELMILYVVDESHAYWYIRDDLLDHWQVSRADLHALAMQNLDNYFQEHTMEFMLAGDDDGPRILMPNRPDAYNTSRLLSEAFHGKLQELLGQEFAVGVPNRDFFVAVSLESRETVEQIRQKVSGDFAQMDHPLSDRLLLVSSDGVSEYLQDPA